MTRIKSNVDLHPQDTGPRTSATLDIIAQAIDVHDKELRLINGNVVYFFPVQYIDHGSSLIFVDSYTASLPCSKSLDSQ